MSVKPKVVVVGSINMDMVTKSSRFPKKGETITGVGFDQFPGGKGANQAVAAARLGADVTMIGAVGNDHTGQALLEHLKKEKINTDFINVHQTVSTGMAQITVAEEDNHIIIVPGANHAISKEQIESAVDVIKEADIMLLQLEIPLEMVEYAASVATQFGVKVILNPAPAQELPGELIELCHYITPNETELTELTGETDIIKGTQKLLSASVDAVVVTLGSMGASYRRAKDNENTNIVGIHAEVVDTTGAGDTFNGALAVALAEDSELEKAVPFANAAAALSVTKFGAQSGMPTAQEMLKYKSNE
ncbi:ribokinase [Alkalicoccobacillus porphyridii]|uniref:Ribokinase n=1 Tax=Alkalicoccobacillus porphyridii TaxID=2597270 RepID=A0A554A407_9BACI|nr:ribokinase [Alkalicoccobacillus porphyridii]TSB48429.1 ribokinase [Alkalicoccobacillus porphyridii]